MQKLPMDIMRVITSFMTLKELNDSHQATRDFSFPRQQRKKRVQWCARKVKRHKLKSGYCADTTCEHQKAVLVRLEPVLETIVLSNYCAKHNRQYTHTDVIEFI